MLTWPNLGRCGSWRPLQSNAAPQCRHQLTLSIRTYGICGLPFKIKPPLFSSINLIYKLSDIICLYLMHNATETFKFRMHSTDKSREKERHKTVSLPESAWLWFCSFGCVAGAFPKACQPPHSSKCIYITSTLGRQASLVVKAEAPPRLRMITMAIT